MDDPCFKCQIPAEICGTDPIGCHHADTQRAKNSARCKINYTRNKERYIARAMQWADNNPEKRRAISKNRYWKNPEAHRMAKLNRYRRTAAINRQWAAIIGMDSIRAPGSSGKILLVGRRRNRC